MSVKLPGTALIATVYNEGSSIQRWLTALAVQSSWPEEFVIVDGASKDNTVALIKSHPWPAGFPAPKVIIQRCNIAAGRNIAIKNCRGELLLTTDAGSSPEPNWIDEIVKPLLESADIAVVGGDCPSVINNSFQRRIAPFLHNRGGDSFATSSPSSRNSAFRRNAWAAVGGYPEWLSLTAEDSSFYSALRTCGFQLYYQPSARVIWEGRPDFRSYMKMMYSYGFGSAEAGEGARIYRRYLLTSLVPPLILFSPHPLADAPLRYARNAAGAFGWLAGKIWGRKPPTGWKSIDGVWLSPEAQAYRVANSLP